MDRDNGSMRTRTISRLACHHHYLDSFFFFKNNKNCTTILCTTAFTTSLLEWPTNASEPARRDQTASSKVGNCARNVNQGRSTAGQSCRFGPSESDNRSRLDIHARTGQICIVRTFYKYVHSWSKNNIVAAIVWSRGIRFIGQICSLNWLTRV